MSVNKDDIKNINNIISSVLRNEYYCNINTNIGKQHIDAYINIYSGKKYKITIQEI
jgi:hypothetical protein